MNNEKFELLETKILTSTINNILYELLKKVIKSSFFIESIFAMLNGDDKKQKMIEFLQQGETNHERIFLRTAELNRGISLL